MNHINTLFWNVRGLAGVSTASYLKRIIAKHKVCLCAISEPRIAFSRLRSINVFPGVVNGITNEDEGGQLWIFWRSDVVARLIHKTDQMITVEVSFNHKTFFVTAVYARCTVQR